MQTQAVLHASQGQRHECVELHGTDWHLGSSSSCDIQLAHPSVVAQHAQLMLRRGRFLLRGTSSGTVARSGDRVQGPVVLAQSDSCQLGAVTIRVASQAGPRLAQLAALTGDLGRQRGQSRLRSYAAESGEVYWAPCAPRGVVGLAVGEGQLWHQPMPTGVRLQALLNRVQDESLRLPGELAVVFVSQLAAALSRYHRAHGAHGAVGPSLIHLGTNGSVCLVAAPIELGPDPGWLSPERAYGSGASRQDDAFTFASLSMHLLRICQTPTHTWGPLTRLLQVDPARRALDVTEAAAEVRARSEALGLDPTAQHLARAVRLLAAEQRDLLLPRSFVGA